MSRSIALSIIIPVYNVENYLSECLNSVYNIPISSTEIICIDDGSTDNSIKILQKHASVHPNLTIIQQDHSGASAARNHGIDIAKGEYIFFLDSDDYILSGENLKKALYLASSQNADIVFFNALVDNERHYINSMQDCTLPITGVELMNLFYKTNGTVPTPVWLQLYNRQFLLTSKIRQKEGSYHEDELFTPEVLYCASNVLYLNSPIINYRQNRPGAITTLFGSKYYNDWVNIGRDLFHFFSSREATEDVCFRQVIGIYIQLIFTLHNHNIASKKYISVRDYSIMRSCIRTPHDRKCYRISRISPKLMVQYLNNTLPPIIRKGINRFL